MQCAYSQPVSDKVVPLLFSLFCKILETNAMHCFSASSVSCVTERLSGCKDTDLYWIRANYYLKKYYSTVAFFDNFNRTTSCITVNELQTMGNVNMVACFSKKKTVVEQTNHSPNDYEKVASDTIV